MTEPLPDDDVCLICGEFAWFDESDEHDVIDLSEMSSWVKRPTYTEYLP